MAVTVKARAKAYAVAIELRKLRHLKLGTGSSFADAIGDEALVKRVQRTAKVTPSLLALARINLQRELRRKLRSAA